MCLIILTEDWETPKVQIAKEDITVYKILLKDHDAALTSPYQNFEYRLNRLYHAAIGRLKSNRRKTEIEEGLHSYSCPLRANSRKDSFKRLWVASNVKIYMGIIPKDSEYYTGIGNEIVSNYLILKEEVD